MRIQDLFDGGLVLDYLKTVKSFMDSHPNDIFTFLFTNPENASPKNVWAPLFEQSGLAGLAYIPPHLPMKSSEWPTLGAMIQSGKRLVVFSQFFLLPPYLLVLTILSQWITIRTPPTSHIFCQNLIISGSHHSTLSIPRFHVKWTAFQDLYRPKSKPV